MKFIFTFGLALLFVLGAKADSLQSHLNKFKAEVDFPALSGLVVSLDKTVLAVNGVRRAEGDEPVTVNDKWHLGSITKSMTGSLVALLTKKGVLSWKTKVSDVFPDFEVHPDYVDLPITRFLTLTGGINDAVVFSDSTAMSEIFNPKNSIQTNRFLLSKYILEKGFTGNSSKLVYSNVSFVLVGAVLEKLTGKSWESLIETELFSLLGMDTCGFGPTTKDPSTPALQPWGHKRNKSGQIYSIKPDSPQADNHPATAPAGTVHCDLKDFAKYLRFHLKNIKLKSNVFDAADIHVMYGDLHKVSYTPLGLVAAKGQKTWRFWHNGSNTMNYAHFIIDPLKSRVLAAATNFGGTKEDNKETSEDMREILRFLTELDVVL